MAKVEPLTKHRSKTAMQRKISQSTIAVLLTIEAFLTLAHSAVALPPPEETPEEILRTEIILEARSPIDGEPLTPAEYALLQEELSQYPEPEISPEIRRIIRLLYLRQAIRSVFPFLLR